MRAGHLQASGLQRRTIMSGKGSRAEEEFPMNKRENQNTSNTSLAGAGRVNRESRKAAPLTDGFNKRLVAYAAGAGAAGVGLLALAQPARGEIVYTHTHVILTRGYLDLDLNNDGRADFRLFDSFDRTGQYAPDILALVRGVNSQDAGVAWNSYQAFPAALEAGYKIGPGDKFFSLNKSGHNAEMAFFSFYVSHGAGQWLNVDHRYLGFVFTVSGQIHYGWAELSVNTTFGKPITAVLEGYAYETAPDTAILAGEKGKESAEPGSAAPPQDAASAPGPLKKDGLDSPASMASLGLLALGSLGLGFWRRKQQESEQ
jgi:hypothetical protein